MKRGGPDHPKTRALARILRINHAWAVGILEMLWHFAAQYAPAGDIGRYSDEEIVEACGWPSDRSAQELIDALVACRWLDPHEGLRLVIHDWHEHADDAVHFRLAKARRRFANGAMPRLDGLHSTERAKALADFSGQQPPQPDPERQSSERLATATSGTPRRATASHGAPRPATARHGMPEPLPEPLAAQNVNSRTPPYPHGTDSPPPLTSTPVEIRPQAPAAEHARDDEPPPLAQAESEHPPELARKPRTLPADPRAAIQTLARRRSMPSSPPASRDRPRDERSFAIAVTARMLTDWMEHRAAALGPPDEQLCARLLELHHGNLDSVAAWLKALRRRSKHPASVQSWGWFLHLAECELRRPTAAAAGGAG